MNATLEQMAAIRTVPTPLAALYVAAMLAMCYLLTIAPVLVSSVVLKNIYDLHLICRY